MDIEDFLSKAQIPVYKKQAEAIENQRNDARLFSFESRHLDGGCRRYICVSLRQFHDFYSQQTSKLHFYEIVQENRPCRPYFDLEFSRLLNESLDPETCYQEFVNLCRAVFKSSLDIHLEESSFLTLDSSTAEKYSAHVVIHLPNRRLFSSHLALKHFVEHLTTEMIKQQKCLVMKGDEEQTFLCDTAVYTKNRNFRLYYSTKRDKEARLEYAPYCKFYARKPMDSRIFFDSLVVPEQFEAYSLIHSQSLIPQQQSQILSDTQSQCLNAVQNVASPAFPDFVNVSTAVSTGSIKLQPSISLKTTSSKVRDLCKSAGPSPFFALDNWFILLIQEHFPLASIRLWTLSYVEQYERRQIQYALNNCRFCHNIKREHRRQNVYWIVNLEEFCAYQRCFDRDCRSFTSEKYPISEKVRERSSKIVDNTPSPPTRLSEEDDDIEFLGNSSEPPTKQSRTST